MVAGENAKIVLDRCLYYLLIVARFACPVSKPLDHSIFFLEEKQFCPSGEFDCCLGPFDVFLANRELVV